MIQLRQLFKRMIYPVDATNLARIEPVSNVFGLDRGMPIDRYYIEKFLSKHEELIKGNVLEIGETTYSSKYASKDSKLHVLTKDNPPSGVMLVDGDLTVPDSLPNKKMDCFICTQTLNFIQDVHAAIEGCYSVLSDGGVLLATVSGISQVSRYDMDRWGDYWRFTSLGIQRLFEEVFPKDHITIEQYGNLATVIAELQGLCVEDLPNKSVLDKLDLDYPLTIGIMAYK